MWSNPERIARARSALVTCCARPSPSCRPSRNCDSINPELPRAPRTLACAIAEVTAGSGASPRSRRACATARSVRHMLVPVSPSGTGNTLMRFSSSRPAATQSAAASSERRSRGPSTYAMPTVTAGPSLLDHHDRDFGPHLGMQLDADGELAERADRLGEIDLALVDVNALFLEAALNVARRHRTVQLLFLPDLHRERERDPGQAGGLDFGRLLLRRALLGDAFRLEGDALLVARGGRIGQSLGEQVIAGVAVLDLDDVAGGPEVRDGFAQNDFHRRTLYRAGGRLNRRWRNASQVSNTPSVQSPGTRTKTGTTSTPATAAPAASIHAGIPTALATAATTAAPRSTYNAPSTMPTFRAAHLSAASFGTAQTTNASTSPQASASPQTH